MPQFNLDEYVDVQTRITKFWEEYPDGAIRPYLMSPESDFEKCRYRAEVFKDRNNELPDAIGHAFELAGNGMANKTSHEENAETSAIGRALANMGYATSSKDRPSRQEMEKVARHTELDEPHSQTASSPSQPKSQYQAVHCPKCGGEMWDNRQHKTNPKAPDFKCKDKTCDGVIWPPKPSDPKEDIDPQNIMEVYGGER